MGEKRVIKKYPNRRLYDTEASRYITLDDVRKLVLDGVDFAVVDKKTGEDITRSILLQIILEQEDSAGHPLFTTDVLHQLIGLYGQSVQGMASSFLQQSLALFEQQQQAFQQQVQSTLGTNPLATMSELTRKNLELWERMQREFFGSVVPGPRPGADSGSGSDPDSGQR